MSEPQRRPFDPEPLVAVSNDPPKVLVRAIVTPPGMPWEQTRAANLDARHGAPLPLGELMHRVKRLSSWAPAKTGRFAVFYVRAKEFREPFETQVDVDGQSVRVAFGLGGEQVRRAQRLGLLLLLFVLGGSAIGAGLTLALNARAETTARLEAEEKLASAKLASAKSYRHSLAEARQLKSVVGNARDVAAVIDDLAWVASAKTPEARISAVHWASGVMAVEAKGDQAPFVASERQIERSARPLRPGVWLWGVGRRKATLPSPDGGFAP